MDYLPVVKKCCFCLPLRYGLLTVGYFKLVAALLGFSVYLMYLVIFICLGHITLPNDIVLVSFLTVAGIIIPTEIVLHIIFLIGAHKKNLKLLVVYYYYALFMWVTTIILSIVGTTFFILSLEGAQASTKNLFIPLDVISLVFSIIVQTFLIISLRSEIIKLKSNCPYRFVRNDNDPEGTVNSVKDEDDVLMNNTTTRIL